MEEIDLEEHVGRPTTDGVVTIERATVREFAESVLDRDPLYRNRDAATAAGFDDVPVPPTYWFSAAPNHNRWEEEQPPDPTGGHDPMAEVMGRLLGSGGMILHAEQEFTYHRPVVVGEKLRMRGVVRDAYRKQTGDRTMTFMVVETTYSDASGEPAVTSVMNLMHRS